MDQPAEPVLRALDGLGIAYESYEHPPVFNTEDVEQHWRDIPGTPVKNLFLRNKKGNHHYLVIVGVDKRVDLKELVKVIGDDRLSFGSAERLMEKLGLTPGSVSPFGLLHPGSKDVEVIIDTPLRQAEKVLFHPNINTATLTITFSDLARFLSARGNRVRYLDI
jgi:Ala-tRNA(Pro) deacylase